MFSIMHKGDMLTLQKGAIALLITET